jgi:nitronate monooxygenase
VVARTAFTRLTSVRYPIALAPMGGTAGGALTAAVSNSGGFGILGGGRCDRDWLERELGIVAAATTEPWGVGFQAWSAEPAVVELALQSRPVAVMLSFGDPEPFVECIRRAEALLIVQVTDLDEARHALRLGADVLVAQGAEAGGHGGGRSTLPFVPAVVDLAGSVPVLAAGGIADGRGLAAALTLGAAGALVGTRFQASAESLAAAPIQEAIVAARGDDTVRSRTLDIAITTGWPERYTSRVVRNAVVDQWLHRNEELAASTESRAAYKDAAERGDMDVVPVWAGEAVDLISTAPSAADIVASMMQEAEEALRTAHAVLLG